MIYASKSFANQISDLATTFKASCAAKARFYWEDGNGRGLRLEATDVRKEFVETVEFGSGQEGFLFYNAPTDFDFDNDDGPITYRTYFNSENPMAVRMDFFAAAAANPFSSFLSRDTDAIRGKTTDIPDGGSGKWQDLQPGTSFASLHKVSSSFEVVLKVPPIGKEAIFNVPDNSQGQSIGNSTAVLSCASPDASSSSLDTPGVFRFVKLSELDSSVPSVVNYDGDRIIFYPGSDHSEFTGVFFPLEVLPIDNHLDGNPPSVTWHDLK
ncbi:hypothetical protein BC834DRAFT_632282 [Gloeopeniophorella convolvens]|nr:hypothetical protein BC834DRAFT_632282 [Gloeopeniophorella convolvens]